MERLKYFFDEIENCNFCGRPTSENKILGQRLNKSQGFAPKSKWGITTTVVRCTNCSLIYSNPQPVPFDIQSHYGIPPESYWREAYFKVNPNYFSRQIETAKKLIAFQKGMKALDIGAGIGKCMISLERAGFDTYGLEPSVSFRNKALDVMGISPDRLKTGMIEDSDYPEGAFHFITFGAVLEHLYNPAQCIEKALRWLSPDGIIQIEVPSSDWLVSKILNLYYRLKGTTYVTNLSPMHEPFHLYEFGLISFKELSRKLDFQIAHHEYDVSIVYHLPKPLHPLLKWYMGKTNQGMQLTVWLKKTKLP
ncbi:class I SAM-dependent methyltransferase [Pontibacter sp. E15-1]|uniref:class I SAM-dependent methyltransferase n=1 Tax=Pontibacter sp. E15-1 TaxID=2919918 RepID=UPI001F50166F|nr:class I SAM-dependent methyltransferase [Pontibacter sp. E15-1]MCJ8163784.1 class I SAM-dependent methyltransferase [Pontibacter sp. E15-1]